MSAGVRTPHVLAGAEQLAALCALVRARRASLVPAGSEQEIAWHAIVPPQFRQPLSTPQPAVAGAGASTPAADQPCNPS